MGSFVPDEREGESVSRLVPKVFSSVKQARHRSTLCAVVLVMEPCRAVQVQRTAFWDKQLSWLTFLSSTWFDKSKIHGGVLRVFLTGTHLGLFSQGLHVASLCLWHGQSAKWFCTEALL